MLLAAVSFGLSASGSVPGGIDAADAASGRPNVVLIQADDQTTTQFKQQVMPKTMRLLAKPGTTFTDYIATTALCCPSRASLFTGQYAHNNGVTSNGNHGGYPALVDKGNVLPVWLQQAGYNTIHVGKFMNAYQRFVPRPTDVAPGWTDWQTILSGESSYYRYHMSNNGRSVFHAGKNNDYVTRVLTRKAVRAVRRYAPSSSPFYLQVDERAPHVAAGNRHGRCGGRIRYPEPDPRDKREFRDAPLPKPPSFNERNMSDKPAFLRSAPLINARDRKRIREHWRCGLASLRGVDRSVAGVYNAVKQAGELNKTVFVYISDNGQFYGEHRLTDGKVLPYEEALRQPLVMKVPRRYRDGRDRVISVHLPVANIDLAPTILDLAHGSPCPPLGACRVMDGRSLMPLLTGSGRWPQPRALLTEYRAFHPRTYGTCDFAGIRTRSGIYVEHYSVADPTTGECHEAFEVERYDLKSDPFELRNLCYAGVSADCPTGNQQANLEQRLQALRDCAGIQGRDHRVDGRPFCE